MEPSSARATVESALAATLFSEPSGRPNALVMFASAVVFLSLHVAFGVFGDATGVNNLLLALGFALSGTAESLPADRRRAAGVLRTAAIGVILGLLVGIATAPEIVVGV